MIDYSCAHWSCFHCFVVLLKLYILDIINTFSVCTFLVSVNKDKYNPLAKYRIKIYEYYIKTKLELLANKTNSCQLTQHKMLIKTRFKCKYY